MCAACVDASNGRGEHWPPGGCRRGLEHQLRPLDLTAGVHAALDDPARGRYLLACDGDRIVGQLMLTTEWSDWRNGVLWWIQSVYIPPETRRRGVFRALFAHVQSLARATPGVVGLRLYVEQNNTVAHEVYRRVGMQDACYRVFEQMFEEG